METILVLGADEQVLSTLFRMLTRLGYTLMEAHSGPEALAMLKASPDVHLLITDTEPPGPPGVNVAKQARELRPGLKVLLVSGYNNATGHAFLAKPLTMGSLALKVRAVLDAPN